MSENKDKDLMYMIGEIQGTVEQMNQRLNHIETRLSELEKGKVGKWEIRIWAILIVSTITLWSTVFLHFITLTT